VTSLQSSNDITAVLCCYTLARWSDITAGVHALGEQTRLPEVILVVVDHNDELLGKARAELPALAGVPVEVVPNAHRKGLSGARNTAIETARTEQIAFLDDDAKPEPDWLERLAAELKDESVLIAGGRSTPRWPGERPRWFPAEFDWVVGSSYYGMPAEAADVRNVHGASMLFRKSTFDRVGGFAEDVGRVGVLPVGCEETELCIRVRQQDPRARIRYVPSSLVHHRVSDDRVRYRYFVGRCYAEGLSKAQISAIVGRTDSTADERDYSSKVLPRGVVRGLRDGLRGDVGGPQRALAIIVGFVTTVIGFGVGTAREARRARAQR
jgi:GT2 family glycosyltransferase